MRRTNYPLARLPFGTITPHVYGQRVSGAGVLVGDNITVTAVADRQTDHRVAYGSSNDAYLVAWTIIP